MLKYTFPFLMFLLFSLVLSGCGLWGNDDDQPQSTNNNQSGNNNTNTPLIIPTATITIDGNTADWNGISPLATSPQGNGSPAYPGSDIKSLYVAKDNTNIYFRMELWSDANQDFWNFPPPNDGCYRFFFRNNTRPNEILGLGVAYEGNSVEPYYGQWTVGANGSSQGNFRSELRGPTFVAVNGGTIEMKAPFAYMDNPTEFYEITGSVISAMTPSVHLDAAAVSAPQKVLIEGHVRDNGTLSPIPGATISTSLDLQTVISNENGYFFLQTDAAPVYSTTGYTVSINATGYQPYSQEHVWGDHPTAQIFNLIP